MGLAVLVVYHATAEGGPSPRTVVALVIVTLACFVFLPALSGWTFGLLSRLAGRGVSADGTSSEIFIDAPWQDVWALFEPRPRQGTILLGVSHIVAADPAPDGTPRIALVMDREVVGFDKHYLAEVETVEPERFVRLHYVAPVPETMGSKTLSAEYEIHPTETGTWVRYAETLSHKSVLVPIFMAWVRPMRDVLRSLKARVEGTEDTSMVGRVQRARAQGGDIDTAFHAASPLRALPGMVAGSALLLVLALPAILWALFHIIEL